MVYITLFAVAFLSATLLPLGSEGLLLYDISQNYSLILLWIFATLGNTLGAMVNYWLGLKGETYLEEKGHLSAQKMEKARGFFDRYGGWTLLLSWAPIIGDPLTFIAGVLRYKFKWFATIVAVAKGTRYAIVIFLASSLSV
ncbi:DedA family protein [Sulfurovum sp. XGS-02]|uniref:YqaA family protein n=1 Tax=Sulfurovum sp. XGS-02 TaxID=2925411 RepID=UPI00205A7291|nr:YqaA family protein [Sulfurovum sp. XGS-02]UPT78329.1 DedA family protein [Sulfurovum sp. XGS-02]